MMGEETANTMNHLNLGPAQGPENTYVVDDMKNVDPMADETHRFRDFVWGASPRWRGRFDQVPTTLGPGGISTELNQTMDSLANLSSLQVGEGSVTAEDGRNVAPKTCKIYNSSVKDEKNERKEDSVKTDCEDGSFFNCNICLDLPKDPVVTFWGHLFCWSCLYRWLHCNSKCPVCKGEVSIKTVTPIYGRGNDNSVSEEDGDSKIPIRPQARKVESLREAMQRTGITCRSENIALHLGNRSDLTRDLVHPNKNVNCSEIFDRALNRIMTSRGRRRQLQAALPPENEVDLMQWGDVSGRETEENTHLRPLSRPSGQSHRVNVPPPSYAFSPARSPFLDLHFIDRNPDHPMLDENEDFVSSIVGFTNSGDQIDSRGRNDVSRGLDVAGQDSRPPRKRRLD